MDARSIIEIMRRALQFGLLILIGGTFINIAVAWALALWQDPVAGPTQTGLMTSKRESWMISVARRAGTTLYMSRRYLGRTNEEVISGASPRAMSPYWLDLETSPVENQGGAESELRMIEV